MDNQNLPNVPVPGPTPAPAAPEDFAPPGAPPVQPFAADTAYTAQAAAGNPQAPYNTAQPVQGAGGAPLPRPRLPAALPRRRPLIRRAHRAFIQGNPRPWARPQRKRKKA